MDIEHQHELRAQLESDDAVQRLAVEFFDRDSPARECLGSCHVVSLAPGPVTKQGRFVSISCQLLMTGTPARSTTLGEKPVATPAFCPGVGCAERQERQEITVNTTTVCLPTEIRDAQYPKAVSLEPRILAPVAFDVPDHVWYGRPSSSSTNP